MLRPIDRCPCSGGTQPRFLQPLLLALILEAPEHGYGLRTRLQGLGLFPEGEPDMTGIYRALRDMVKNGVLTVAAEKGAGPDRRRYVATDRGRECLERWARSLGGTRTRLNGVLAVLERTRAAIDPPAGAEPASACGRAGTDLTAGPLGLSRDDDLAVLAPLVEEAGEEADFLKTVFLRARAGLPPRREDALRLLSYASGSPEARSLTRAARFMARLAAGDTATVWAAVGVDRAPCPMNCRFCAFGERWKVVDRPHVLKDDRVLATALRLVGEGAAWIVLRTTEDFGQERLRGLFRKVAARLPQGRVLVANTGECDLMSLAALRESGVDCVYHALRLGEGVDTPFDPEKRKDHLSRVGRAGLGLAHLVEPLGPEHGNGEIADVLLTALGAGACVCGVMARSNVPGTPYGESAGVDTQRFAEVVATVRLLSGTRVRHVCVHPHPAEALDAGGNVVVVETGAIPRDREEAGEEWRGFTVADARESLERAGYRVLTRLW